MKGKERKTSLQIDQTFFDGSVALRLSYFLLRSSSPQTIEEQRFKFILLMPVLIVQDTHTCDKAEAPGDFFWRETFLKFESIFICKYTVESGGDQDKTSIC